MISYIGEKCEHVWTPDQWSREALNTTSGWSLMLPSVISEKIPKPRQETSALVQVREERTPPGGNRSKTVGFKR